MRILYQSYWVSRKRIQSEEATIGKLDVANDTKYLLLYEKGEITGEEVARKNHEDGLYYEVILLEEEQPSYFLQIVHENKFIGVSFLDDSGREYLTYHFHEIEPMKKLFLEEIWYSYYSDPETDDEDYRIHFVFDRKGNAAYRKYDEINQKAIDYESNQPLDVSGLYEDYPQFGNYDSLIRLERNMDFLRDTLQ